ncbi:MAG: hypothetical protein RLZZ414_1980 [Bacteroidota bacterium]
MKDLRNNSFLQWYYRNATKVFQPIFGVKKQKEFYEWLFWQIQKLKEGKLKNTHYEYFFTTYFGLTKEEYFGKNILDIGCGPRGSLEWASGANKRVGLDTLAKQYIKMEGKKHQMEYVEAGAENIPFDDGYFDFVSSFNSLDHVDDLQKSIAEIKRVVKSGGKFLLISDIHLHKTICEPSSFSWDIVEQFLPEFNLIKQNHYEGNLLYKSIRAGVPYNHQNPQERYGVLTALFVKNAL